MVKKFFIIDLLKKIGEEIEIEGWVNSKRDHKKIVFIDLRDRSGIIQVVCDEKAKEVSPEDVIQIKGVVQKRPSNLINPNIKTGKIEIQAKEITLISKSKTPVFSLNDDGYKIDEELRLKYRYLDLRRKRMTNNLITRYKFIKEIRKLMDERGFIEVETPMLTRSTPEGARDFVVPSRLQKGKFYALPQSPQQYKQLLMVAGIERYFQITRCFRDEDPRADRAYGEFTQLDIEKSFTSQQEIRKLAEEVIVSAVKKVFPSKKFKIPFPIMTYQEAMKKYKTDRPDIRTKEQKKDKNYLAFVWIIDFPAFEWKESENRWDAVHHPFTKPKDEDLPLLKTGEYKKIRADQYDLVLNGHEIAGGSIRITDSSLQTKIFEILGHTKKEVEEKFGHLLTAFQFGVPPHGGIAFGLDRLLQVILNEPSVREVISFPATSHGKTAVMDAPNTISKEQLKELGIKIEE